VLSQSFLRCGIISKKQEQNNEENKRFTVETFDNQLVIQDENHYLSS